MACITSENRDAWQALADEASKQRPYPGRKVRITGGRKHKGKVGTVMRHQRDRFDATAFRYGGEAALMLRDMEGRYGFCCLIQPEDGTAPFWVKADYTECCND